MKFLLFSDFHYDPGRFLNTGLDGIREMQAAAERAGCDFIIQLGDLCHAVSEVPELLDAYNNCPIPSYHVLGNHDPERTSYAETVAAYHLPTDGYYYFDASDYRMIVLNPNYYCKNGDYVHYELLNWREADITRDWIPPVQLAWLEDTIAASPYPCVIFSHQSFERVDGVQNREAVREIINAANRRRKHSVLLCANGHYHRDNLCLLDNVCYFDVNAASGDWVEKSHNAFPSELYEKASKLHHLVVFERPLYAIVTIEGSEICIEGRFSPMVCGVDYRAAAGTDCYDRCGRPFTQCIKSAKFTIN